MNGLCRGEEEVFLLLYCGVEVRGQGNRRWSGGWDEFLWNLRTFLCNHTFFFFFGRGRRRIHLGWSGRI